MCTRPPAGPRKLTPRSSHGLRPQLLLMGSARLPIARRRSIQNVRKRKRHRTIRTDTPPGNDPKSRAGSRPLSGANRRIANNAAEIEVSNSPRNTRPSSCDCQNCNYSPQSVRLTNASNGGSDAEDPPAAGKGAQLQLHVLIHLAEEDARTSPPKRPPHAPQAMLVQQSLRQGSSLEVILKRKT